MDHNVPTLTGPIDGSARRRTARRAAEELRGVRRASLRDRQRPRGDRPRHRPRARAHAARDDDRLRRQPHVDPRRVRRARASGSARPRSSTCWRRRRCSIKKPKTMRVRVRGRSLPSGLTPKDVDRSGMIGQIGVAGGVGHVLEYAGEAISGFSMEGRMTALQHVDRGGRPRRAWSRRTRPRSPTSRAAGVRAVRRGVGEGARRVAHAPSDEGARYDREIAVDVEALEPQVTWGTNPGMVAPVGAVVPDPADYADPDERASVERALALHGARARDADRGDPDRPRLHRLLHERRIEDLRAAAAVAAGKRVAPGVQCAGRPGLRGGEAAGRGGGTGPGLRRRRLRVAATPAARCAWG